MPGHRVKLTRSEEIAQGTMAFHFTRPAAFDFQAGQTMDITLIDPPETDAEGNVRTFSIASSPFEDQLMIATRMRDTAFKRILRNARPGLEVDITGPDGSLTLHKDAKRPVVFLTGGIGVTPFLSIARQAAHDKSKRETYLIDSNRRPEDTPFLDLLKNLDTEYLHFHFIATMTKMESSHQSWAGDTGLVDAAMLSRHLPRTVNPIYYVAGPPQMVAAMRKLLSTTKVDDKDIHSEEFSGY
jgi:ferredoxin-NADP reductase